MSDFSGLEFLVIDEADRMIIDGQYKELKEILDFVGTRRESKSPLRTLLFSATLLSKGNDKLQRMFGKESVWLF